ncbi:MAG: hypothetical protein ACYTAS_06185 [Planctomycetota bacterium]|jgi:hypothetical protein
MAIPTVEEAEAKLQGILAQIKQGLKAADRSRIADELISFANPASAYAVPAEGAYNELRKTALTIRKELDRALSAAAIEGIRARSEVLTSHVATITAVTAQAEKRVAELKLTVLKETANASKAIIAAAQKAKDAFRENRTQAGYAAIDAIIAELEALGTRLPA